MEQTVSVYPRIVLDDITTAIWREEFRLIDGRGPAHSQYEVVVKRDRDGCNFIDIFNAEWTTSLPWTDFVPSNDLIPADHMAFLKKAATCIEQGLTDHAANGRIFQKYSWLATAFNESTRRTGVNGIDATKLAGQGISPHV